MRWCIYWSTSPVQKRSSHSNADARTHSLPTLLCGESHTSGLGGYEMLDLCWLDQPKSPRSGFDFTSVFALTKFLPSSQWDYLLQGWGEISRLCGFSCWFFQLSGILQFWSQEVSVFLTTYSKVSVCFILLRRRFKDWLKMMTCTHSVSDCPLARPSKRILFASVMYWTSWDLCFQEATILPENYKFRNAYYVLLLKTN